MAYRIAAEGFGENDSTFLAEVRRDVQRAHDERRLRTLMNFLPYRGGESARRPAASNDGDGIDATDSLGWALYLYVRGGWILALFFVPAVAGIVLCGIAKAVASTLRRRAELRRYGRAYHRSAASVAVLIFTLATAAASFAPDGYREAGWTVMGVGWVVSSICAMRRREWITEYTPWLESEVVPSSTT